MKVHLIKERTIREYALAHASSKASLEEWLFKIKHADWDHPAAVKQTFPAADIIGNGSLRVVFDIGGNNYRMICKYSFGRECVRLYVCWIGTHREYDALCKAKKQYSVFIY